MLLRRNRGLNTAPYLCTLMNKAYLLLGTNEGEREQWLKQAIERLNDFGAIERTSSVYETAAWGIEEQPDFLNMVVLLKTHLSAPELLKATQVVEESLGRQRILKWGQRTLDIDILFFNDDVIQTEILHIPHPHLHERRFTLAPLNELASGFIHPVLKKTVAELVNVCKDPLQVRKLELHLLF